MNSCLYAAAVCTLILALLISLAESPSDLHLQLGSSWKPVYLYLKVPGSNQNTELVRFWAGGFLLVLFLEGKLALVLNVFWERLLFAETFIEVYFSQFSPLLLLTFQPILITPMNIINLSSWKHTPLGVFFTSYKSLHEVAQTYVCVFNVSHNLADVTCSIMLQCRFSGVIPMSGNFSLHIVWACSRLILLTESSANLLAHIHEADQIAEPFFKEVFILFC